MGEALSRKWGLHVKLEGLLSTDKKISSPEGHSLEQFPVLERRGKGVTAAELRNFQKKCQKDQV